MCCNSFEHARTLQSLHPDLRIRTITTSLSFNYSKGDSGYREFEHLHQWICFNDVEVDKMIHTGVAPDTTFVEIFGANPITGGSNETHGVPKHSGVTTHMCQKEYRGDVCSSIDDPERVFEMFSSQDNFIINFRRLFGIHGGLYKHNVELFTFLKFTDGVPTQFILSHGVI